MVFSSELDGCECDACGVGSDCEKFLVAFVIVMKNKSHFSN